MVQSPCQGARPQAGGYLCGRVGGFKCSPGRAAKCTATNPPGGAAAEEAVRGPEPPCGGGGAAAGEHLRAAGCAAEALPAAETAEAEQGQRSAFCKRPPWRAAKTGHRNPGGLDEKSRIKMPAKFLPPQTPTLLMNQKIPAPGTGAGIGKSLDAQGRRPGAWERAQDFTAGRALRSIGRRWYQVKPLALSRFLRCGAAPACKNRSAAPAAAPCFIHWMRSPPLPLVTFLPEK